MSEIMEIDNVLFTDLGLLQRACAELKAELVEARGFQTYTTDGEVYTEHDSEYIIRSLPGERVLSELGVSEVEAGKYQLLQDEDVAMVPDALQPTINVDLLKQEYARLRIISEAEANGYQVHEEQFEDGTKRVIASR